jgi:calcium-dependent protein kinase
MLSAEPSVSKIKQAVKEAFERQILRLRFRDHGLRVTRMSKHYRIMSRLGDGAFGEVFKALHYKSNKTVALKKLLVNQDNIDEVRREIMFMEMFESEFIVKLYDSFRSSNRTVYISMELCTGGDLFDTFADYADKKQKGFPESLVKRIAFEMISGIQYAHSKEIAHLDLKLENVMLSRPWSGYLHDFPSIKLVDWGLAYTFDEMDQCPNCPSMGTPGYMAPEVIKRKYNGKADMWSLGVCFYLMLANRLPILTKFGMPLWVRMLVSDRPEHQIIFNKNVWDNMSEDCTRFVKSLLVKDPESRPSAEEALSDIWFVSRQSIGNGLDKKVVPEVKMTSEDSIVYRLSRYIGYNQFKRHVLHQLILDEEFVDSRERKRIARHFNMVSNMHPEVSLQKVRDEVLKYARRQGDDALISRVLELDVGEHVIDKDEFLVAMLAPFYNTPMRLMDFFSEEAEGYSFDVDYLREFFKGDLEKALRVFHEMDKNSDGEIEASEFIKWMLNDLSDK